MATAEVVPEVKPTLADKAIDIRGKKYVLVADRIVEFNEKFPNGSIVPELLTSPKDDEVWLKVTICPDVTAEKPRYFVGHSQARWGDGHINKASALENAETSAVGRALAMMGIGVLGSLASADEIVKANNSPERGAQTADEYSDTFENPDARIPQVRVNAITSACDTHGVPHLAQEQYLKKLGLVQWEELPNRYWKDAFNWATTYQKQTEGVERQAQASVAILEARRAPSNGSIVVCEACGSHKIQPAGISRKTQKPYKAFCKDCKHTVGTPIKPPVQEPDIDEVPF